MAKLQEISRIDGKRYFVYIPEEFINYLGLSKGDGVGISYDVDSNRIILKKEW
jgi:bifunctional DNA-binding transcriptional regulator/antitoxin component of YhaV-PrlF toxin-antitoxin module